MTRKLKYTSLLLSLLAAFAACSDEWWNTKEPDAGKTPIELSVGGVDMPSSQTRAVITDGTNKTKQAFYENTSLYMLMKSECVDGTHDHNATAHGAKVTRTIMFALPKSGDNDYSDVNYSASNEYDKFVRFWEDSYSRSSALSILAVCTPGMGAGVDQKAWRTGGDAAYSYQGWTAISGDGSYPQIEWPIGESNKTDQSVYTKDKKNQDVSFIKNQDLCFSNNIGNWTEKGGSDRRMKYDFTNKRFPNKTDQWTTDGPYKTRMIFYHALSKLTFKIKKGEGFTDTNFKFDKETVNGEEVSTNIKLTNFYNSGIFNIEEGEFINTTEKPLSKDEIKRIYQHPSLTSDETNADYKYILDALVIPGTNMNDAATIGVVFKIAGNEYRLPMRQLYDAIVAGISSGKTAADYFDKNGTENDALHTKLKAGIHYVFTLTVGKTKIEKITAQLVPWETVESTNFFPDNSFIDLSLLTKSGTELTEGVDFYRGLNLFSGTDLNHDWKSYDWQSYNWTTTNAYEKALDPQYKAASGTTPAHWETDWYWDSNRHFYHFRAIVPSSQELQGNGNGTSADPKVSLQAKRIVQDGTDSDGNPTYSSNYTDVMWGAPFLATTNALTYSITKGFDGKGAEATEASRTHQIHWAIGPTKDEIKLVTFHLMSEVTINIQTSTDGSADRVMLGDGTDTFTKVELIDCASSGTANIGDGCVNPGTIVSSQTLADDISTSNQTLRWGVIPQSLEDKKLRIVTPDGNEYVVDLAEVVVSTTPTNNISTTNLANPYQETATGSGKYKIDYWYPNYKYTYTFTLLKMGIANLSATIVDWETVTAEDETVQIQ